MAFFRSFYTPFLLLICLVLSSCIGIAKAEYRLDPRLTIYQPIDYTKLMLMPTASKAHSRECEGESEKHIGYLTIDNTNEIDVYRCIRWVQTTGKGVGTFKIKAVDNDFHQVGFPYLTWISYDLIVDGETALDEVYFPRLSWVGHSIILDLRTNVEYVDTPSLKKAKQLTVHFRENNVDLNGQNAITTLDTLILENELEENAPFLNGLQKLTSLKSYQINGGDVLDPDTNTNLDDGGFLESLVTMDGNISINTANMSRLYGMGNIATINGNFTIRNTNSNSTNLNNLLGLEKVENINGTLKIEDIPFLNSLNGIGKLNVNNLVLRDNPNLSNVSALNNISISNNGSVTFDNLHTTACPTLLDFVNSLDASVSVNFNMICE